MNSDIWYRVYFEKKDILARSENSIKLVIPSGRYKGFSFWVSRKLAKEKDTTLLGKIGLSFTISRSVRHGTLWVEEDTQEVSFQTIYEAFSIKSCAVEYTTLIPTKLDPVKNQEILKELLR